MTVPFACVFIAFMLTVLTKAPVAVAQNRQPGGYDNRLPRDQQSELSGWGRRALGAHLNSLEAFPAFAAAVLVAHLAGADPGWSAGLAVTHVAARSLYTVCYIADVATVRSLVWTVAFGATAGLFVLGWLG